MSRRRLCSPGVVVGVVDASTSSGRAVKMCSFRFPGFPRPCPSERGGDGGAGNRARRLAARHGPSGNAVAAAAPRTLPTRLARFAGTGPPPFLMAAQQRTSHAISTTLPFSASWARVGHSAPRSSVDTGQTTTTLGLCRALDLYVCTTNASMLTLVHVAPLYESE